MEILGNLPQSLRKGKEGTLRLLKRNCMGSFTMGCHGKYSQTEKRT